METVISTRIPISQEHSFATILANLSGADLRGYTASSFTDVSKTAWYSAAVEWAYEEGIVTGSNGKFEPNANITRQDMAVMIARYAEKAADYALPATNKAVVFTDSNGIASYASDAVAAIQAGGHHFRKQRRKLCSGGICQQSTGGENDRAAAAGYDGITIYQIR